MLIFGGVLVPALGFVDVYPMRFSFVADHFQYHASIALLALVAAIAADVYARLSCASPDRTCGWHGGVDGARRTNVPAIASILRCRTTLSRHDREESDRATAYANLAVYLESVGKYAEALSLAAKR